jgi:hypothetical protein
VFDLLNGFVSDAETLLRNGMLVLGIIFVGWTWWRSKALTSTLGALLFAAVVIWGVNNFDVLSGVVEQDVNERVDNPRGSSGDPRASDSGN